MNKIKLVEKFSMFDEHWRPKNAAELNGQEVKVVIEDLTYPAPMGVKI